MSVEKEFKIVRVNPEDNVTIERVRSLYEEIFEDSKAFTDYFFGYELKRRENGREVITILAGMKGQAVAAEMFLIRKRLMFGEEEIAAIYIYGVATDISYRKRGYMTMLMKYAIELAHKEGRLIYLIPVNEKIYESFGFQIVKNVDRAEERNKDKKRVMLKKDEAYIESRQREAEADGGRLEIYKDDSGDIENVIYENDDNEKVVIMVLTDRRDILEAEFCIHDLV